MMVGGPGFAAAVFARDIAKILAVVLGIAIATGVLVWLL